MLVTPTQIIEAMKNALIIETDFSDHLLGLYRDTPLPNFEILITEQLKHPQNSNIHLCSKHQLEQLHADRAVDLKVVNAEDNSIRYLVREVLSLSDQGGQGTVSVCQSLKRSHTLVAVKKVTRPGSQADVDRTKREISAYGEIGSHLNIARFIESFAAGGNDAYIVTEYVVGSTLQAAVTNRAGKWCVSIHDSKKWLLGIAEAIRTIHTKNIVHRDIKPLNILIEYSSNEAKLVDFGFAKQRPVGDETHDERRTGTNIAIGTRRWMSPIQFVDAARADERDDIFAFGCVAYYVLFGEPPCYPDFGFGFEDYRMAQENLCPQVARSSTFRSDLPNGLVDLIFRCLLPDRETPFRPRTGEQLLEQLSEVFSRNLTESTESTHYWPRLQFRRLLEMEFIEAWKAVQLSDERYVASALQGIAEKITRLNTRPNAPLLRPDAVGLEIDLFIQLITNRAKAIHNLRDLGVLRRDMASQWPSVRDGILRPLFENQFRVD